MQSKSFGRLPVRFTGQHFTKSKSLIRDMISRAEITKTDLVLDIGAGKGALTAPLSKKAKKVIAIERDVNLAKKLKNCITDQSNVRIMAMDFRKMVLPKTPFKVVSNIPYCITRDIFGSLMDSPASNFIGGTVITEWGAAFKFTKSPQSSSRIVIWNTFYRMVIMQKISPKAFHPPPSIDSAMIKICRREEEMIFRQDFFSYASFVCYLLENHGIFARHVLRKIFTKKQVKRILSDLKIGRNALIQDLTIQQWVAVFYVMKKVIPKKIQPKMPRKYRKRYQR